MNEIHGLAADEVVQLNAWAVEQTGERHAVLSLDLLQSALGRPLNYRAYEGVEDVLWLAVVLLFGIARNQAFSQGNERTGSSRCRARRTRSTSARWIPTPSWPSPGPARTCCLRRESTGPGSVIAPADGAPRLERASPARPSAGAA